MNQVIAEIMQEITTLKQRQSEAVEDENAVLSYDLSTAIDRKREELAEAKKAFGH